MDKCNVVDPPVFWDDVIAMGLQFWRKKNLLAYVCRLISGATIYHYGEIEMKFGMVAFLGLKNRFCRNPV
jgi:hypothetical protein